MPICIVLTKLACENILSPTRSNGLGYAEANENVCVGFQIETGINLTLFFWFKIFEPKIFSIKNAIRKNPYKIAEYYYPFLLLQL